MKRNNPIEIALNILSRRRANSAEIRRGLKEKGFDKEEIDQVILYLEDSHYLNDDELLTDYIRQLVEKRFYGPAKIAAFLHSKGFELESIKVKISEIYDEEALIEKARMYVDRRFGRFDVSDDKIRGKIARSLSHRGFNWNIIERILNI